MAYTAVSLAQLRAQLTEKLEDTPFWIASEANDAINKALCRWNMFTGQWKARVTVTTSAVTPSPWVAVPGTLIYNVRIEYNSVPLALTSLNAMDSFRPTWEGESITAGGDVPTTPQSWFPAGLNLFAYWPWDPVGGNTLTIDGVADTPVLTVDAQLVDLGQVEHHAILGEALHILAFKEGTQRFNATKRFHVEFIRAAAELNGRLKASALFRRYMGLDVNRGEKPMRGIPTQLDQTRS